MPHPSARSSAAETLEPPLPQFDTLIQQRQSAILGMWVFLASEILFFGGLFMAYAVYRASYPEAFAAASARLDLVWGGINTAILLTSSLTMTLADDAVLAGKRRALRIWLAVTAALGAVFLCIKAGEWRGEFAAGLAPLFGWAFVFPGADAEHARLFFAFYFGLTGLHALHLFIGVVLVLVMLGFAYRNAPRLESKIVVAGLYWHLVDVIWVFVFPLLYLAGGRA